VDYLDRLKVIFQSLSNHLEDNNYAIHIFGGDVFDSPLIATGRVLNTARILFDLGYYKEWEVVPGQHDGSLRQDKMDCILVNLESDQFHVHWIPYITTISDGEWEEEIGLIPHGFIEETRERYFGDIIVVHEDIFPSVGDATIGTVRLSEMKHRPKLVLAGHQHYPDGVIKAGETQIVIPGSMGRITRTDAMAPVYAVSVEIEEGEVGKIELIKLADGLTSDDLLSSEDALIAERAFSERQEAIAVLQNISKKTDLASAEDMLVDLIFELQLADDPVAADQEAVSLATNTVRKHT